ncbi:HTTM domain-containing protein [Aurantibacter aestuarii]|uniref:HTTM-like domain-containing protein n=1 Tax=Aurantibacter aestuarii TaxID=1266046 RepID=A0A2T1NCF9_9FLAO|nr:HTTM domain-containing protein [Aurantibacter aestuarii]PSG90106.1 hypothetical protein C7H52_02190 [Aurantibacter aestuarii]
MLNRFLFKQIDNSALVVFRIIFGLLCFLESVGAIFTGWVKRTLIDPDFTFNFIGFDFLQPLPGDLMYYYYFVMGIFGLGIMLGYKYRVSIISFTLMWCGVYFMQKSSYNNHYYLLILLCAIMAILPAHRFASLDAKLNPSIKSIQMPAWCKWIFVLQLFIVYTYASVAKIYPDWLDLSTPKLLMESKRNYPVIGSFLQNDFIPYLVAYGGILYDGLIIPLLLWKRTRKIAFFASIFFHMFNSIVFQVGIFPYLALAFSLFFFEAEKINRWFLKRKPLYTGNDVIIPSYKPLLVGVSAVYFVVQILLPLRHHVIPDDVLWTEEGHRLSWRMMLRSKSGSTSYKIVNHTTKESFNVNLDEYLTKKQQRLASTKPDVIWQFSQRLKRIYKEKGQDISVYVNCLVSVNGKPYKQLINPEVDLAAQDWSYFSHTTWLLPSN